MSTLQASRLESLIVDKICSLEYVSRAAYSDDGREVVILVIHDHNPDKDIEMFTEIGRRGRKIEDEVPDRMITPLAIHDGPDLPDDYCGSRKVVYARENGR